MNIRSRFPAALRMTRRALTAMLAALVVATACTTVESPGSSPAVAAAMAPLRTMTFNIRYGTAPDGEHAWQARRNVAFHVIREYDPAVLGLQEALRFQLDELAIEFPRFREVGVGRDDGATAGEYSAILYDASRLELIEQATFWLSDRPHLPGSMTWGNRYPRLVTAARFRDTRSAATFDVFNTHWDHESQHARERGAALMLERIRGRTAPDDPIIVMGDFNAGEDNPAFNRLLTDAVEPGGGMLYDTFRSVHPTAAGTGTYHAFTGDTSGAKIDAILASHHWHTLDADIVHLNVGGLFPSDHFPVTATLALKARR